MGIIETDLTILVQLTVALILGVVPGIERSVSGKTAGIRTYGLVSMGSALFIIIANVVGASMQDPTQFDTFRVAAAIITGVGFIGAGLIIMRDAHLTGLTTAAGLWVAAGIGIAVGFHLYVIAAFTALLTIIVFKFFWTAEERLVSSLSKKGERRL